MEPDGSYPAGFDFIGQIDFEPEEEVILEPVDEPQQVLRRGSPERTYETFSRVSKAISIALR